jgi:CheY-like chemotaxis protein
MALSGYRMEEELERSRDAGFCNHVVEPVHIAQLQTVMQHLLDGV